MDFIKILKSFWATFFIVVVLGSFFAYATSTVFPIIVLFFDIFAFTISSFGYHTPSLTLFIFSVIIVLVYEFWTTMQSWFS